MQNRRIINLHMAEAGATARPTLESNSLIALFSHIRTGKWASIMPSTIIEAFGPWKDVRTIPIVKPEAAHLVGLIAAEREPHTPIIENLLNQARRFAKAEQVA
jgi:DNA-binding transcriptional LysR family regulator